MPRPEDMDQGRQEGERRRDEGMARAARRKRRLIWRAQLRLLDAIMRSSDRTASTDDAVGDLEKKYVDGGKWRGSVPLGLARRALIRKVGVVPSVRPARHAGLVTVWKQAADDDAIERYRCHLRRLLAAE